MEDHKKYLIIITSILLIFYFNTIGWLVESWVYNPYYSYGFLIPIIAAYLIWKNKPDNLTFQNRASSDLGFYLIISALILYIISFFMTIRFLAGISLILSITGVIIYLYGKETMKEMLFPVGFLILMVPLPFVDILTPPIQRYSAIFSTSLANMIGIPAYNVGYNIHLTDAIFEVDISCSGIRSIISLMVIAVLFAYVLEGSKLMKGVVLFSSIPLALSGNILRITSVLFIANTYGTEAAMEFFHSFSSLVLFSVSLIGLFLVGRCFGRLRFKKIL